MQTLDALIPAIEANPKHVWEVTARYQPDMAVSQIGGATVVSYSFPHPLFNTVLYADL